MRTEHPAVSIITPAYNAARFLSETVSSVLAQTFTNFELLIVDDGSTDDTLAIAREWERKDPRVRALTGPNGGTSAARNRAMREARGSFFALLDSDDVWQPEFLAAQMAVLDGAPETDIVTGNAYNLGGPLHGQPLNPVESKYRPLSLLNIIENDAAVCIMSVFRRPVYDRIGGFDETVEQGEDHEYWVRAAHAGFTFVRNSAPLAYYRRHPDSKTADEIVTLAGIIRLFQQERIVCADRPIECAAIDRQIVQFEQQWLLAQAKAHLLRREFEAAAREFKRLSAVTHDTRSVVLEALSRRVPRALLWAYQARSTLRMLRRRRLAG